MDNKKSPDQLSDMLATLLQDFRESKPEERSEISRRYAVTITELEKVYAYFREYIVSYIEV
jgi:hypothetical protein